MIGYASISYVFPPTLTNRMVCGDWGCMRRAAAIVTDHGSILSHAAIVARELKKPCIVNTREASSRLKTREMVEVDAERGIVKKIINPTVSGNKLKQYIIGNN